MQGLDWALILCLAGHRSYFLATLDPWIQEQPATLRSVHLNKYFRSVALSSSMKRVEVVLHKLTDPEVKRLCCSHDSIKQEAGAEDMVHVTIPKSENPPITKMVKNEGPDDELEDITVKEEPIDWHQEPQNQMSTASFALTFKKEVDDACAEAHTERAEAEGELREGSPGASNSRAVHQRSAGASQGSADSLPSDVSGSGSGVEVNPPDVLKSVRILCAHCDYSSTRKDEFELHIRDEHKLAFDFKCLFSSYSGLHSNKSKLRIEVKRDERSILKLGPCSGKMPVKEHERAKQGVRKLYKCELCGYSTAVSSHLKGHQASKHKLGIVLKCELCDYSTCYAETLKRHQASKHKVGNLLKCQLCDYSACYPSALKRHQAMKHKVGNLLKCELCDYSTCYPSNLKFHQASKHKVGNLLKCELCDYSTCHTNKLKRHQAIKHKFGNRLKCELCDYSACYPSNLRLHQASKHKVGNLLKCELCDYSAYYPSNLKFHQAIKHKLGNLLKCNLCDYSTCYANILKIHQASKHKVGNLLKCEMCDYSTCYNTNKLKRHQAVKHKLGNLLKCELCDYSVRYPSKLKFHQAITHKLGNLLKCKLCDYSTCFGKC